MDSRTLRFASPATDDVIDILCDRFEAHSENHILFAIEDCNLDFVAVGHIALEGDMELAFSVLKEYQGQGMGDALMQRVLQHCRALGHLKGHMVCLPHNQAVRHLCSKNGIKVHTQQGESEGTLELPAPTLATIISEAGSRNLGFYDYLSKRTLLPWTILSQ